MTTQLRIFTINKARMDDFLQAWKAGVHPLRLAHAIESTAWVIKEPNEFVWLLSHDGNDWDALEAAYYRSSERTALDPDPAQYIAKAERWFLTPVL